MLFYVMAIISTIFLLYLSFQIGECKYRINRNIIVARFIPFIFCCGLLFVFILQMYSNVFWGADYTLFENLSPIVIAFLIFLSTLFEYIKHGEGLYHEGVFISGLFFSKEMIFDYKITYNPNSNIALWTLFYKNIFGLSETRTIHLHNQVAHELEEQLKSYL